MYECLPIVIPAFEPTDQMLELCNAIRDDLNQPVVVVNDGSNSNYNGIFEDLSRNGFVVLKHEKNYGKGRALKTAFGYALNRYPEAIGVITADADGQHRPEDIRRVMEALRKQPDSLVIGVRNFDHSASIPWKSRFGNKLTRILFRFLYGLQLTDTQTGLRGIPISFVRELLHVPGDRFEFETNMLIETGNKVSIMEVPIETVYDSKTDHATHFNPIVDSIKIYRIFAARVLKYAFASLSSFIIDILLFGFFCRLLKPLLPAFYIGAATVFARMLSSTYNFGLNYRFVFGSSKKKTVSAVRYFTLVVIIMALSSLLTTIGVWSFPLVSETIVKILVDTFLFLVSYKAQQKYVF